MSGGEPLLAERFTELVLLCRMRGAAVSVITSGTVGGEDEFARLLHLRVDLFEIPVNCDQSSLHDAIAGIAGSWHRAVRTLRILLDRGAVVTCVIVLTRLNATRIVPTLDFLATAGVRTIMLNRFNLGGAGIQARSGLLLDADELREAYRADDEAAARLSLSVSANVGTPLCIIDPRHYPHIMMSSCGRVPDRMPLTLGADGSLRLCNHSPVILGNIRATGSMSS
jgi:MoaA/NifB/PqqE/SkfB family radical SAM enzyme